MSAVSNAVRASVQLVAAILLLIFASGPSLAASAQAPGSRVVMDLPAGFSVSPTFSGFVHAPSGATIILLEVPASAYPDMVRGLSPEKLASRGVQSVKTGKLDRQGDYIYITAEQPAATGTYAKYVLLFRQGHVTALISASVPKRAIDSGALQPSDFERLLASAHLAPDTATADKPYVLGYTGPFQDTGAFVGQTHFYAISGRPPQAEGAEGMAPTLIVSASLGADRIENLDEAGRAGISALAPGRELQDIGSQSLTVSGLEGIEHVMEPSGSGGGDDSGIYQVILRGKEGGYYRIVGTASADEWPTLLPEFRKIALSLTPRA